MKYIIPIVISLLFFYYNGNPYFSIAVLLQIWSIFNLAGSISHKIPLFEFMLYQYIFSVIFMPVFGYIFYAKETEISKLIGWYMKVPYDVYYKKTFVFMAAIIIAVKLFDRKVNSSEYLYEIYKKFIINEDKNAKAGKFLFIIGIIGILSFGRLGPLNYFAYLCKLCFFVAPIFLYYSKVQYRKYFLFFAIAFFIVESVGSGMFGEFLLYIMALISVITYKMKVNKPLVSALLVASLFFMTFLQMVKPFYRAYTWNYAEYDNIKKVKRNKFILFMELSKEVFINRRVLLSIENMYGPYSRFNQGLILSMVYDYIPNQRKYLKGKRLLLLFSGVLIPRLFWESKPESGGKYNMINFTGYRPRANTSINIGPIGEAYGNFGILGGILFLMVYIGIISYSFKYYLIKAAKYTVLWGLIPLVFYGIMATQSEIYDVLNGIFKTTIFLFILSIIYKAFYKSSFFG